MKNSFRKFQKMPLLVSLALLGSSLLVFFLLYKSINENKKESDQNEKNVAIEVMHRAEAQSLYSAIKSIDAERSNLETHFAQSSDIVPFLDMFGRLSNQAGTQTEVSSIEISSDNLSLIVTSKSIGSFQSVYKFINLLENSSYELEFLAVDIETQSAVNTSTASASKTKPTAEWTANLKIKLVSFMQ